MAFLTGVLAFLIGIVYSSFFEWMLHRYILHSPTLLKYPFRAHQLEHHGIFRADATYFLSEKLHVEEDKKHLTFAWWNAPALIALHAPLLGGVYLLAGIWACAGTLLAMISYYAMYEYLHYCMHVPKNRWIERTRFFEGIQAHHRYHHVYYMRNLNVVLPLWDFILRTRGAAQEGLYEKLESVRLRREDRAQEPVASDSASR